MELNVKEQTEKLQSEIVKLQAQLQQIKQANDNVVAAILKNAGKLELLQSLATTQESKKEKDE